MTAAISIALAQVLPWLIVAPIITAALASIHLWCRSTDPDPWPIHDSETDQ